MLNMNTISISIRKIRRCIITIRRSLLIIINMEDFFRGPKESFHSSITSKEEMNLCLSLCASDTSLCVFMYNIRSIFRCVLVSGNVSRNKTNYIIHGKDE